MKPHINRRFRRRTASHETVNSNKENKQEQSFFGEASHETFFQPLSVVQRKCEKCEDEEKVQRQPEKKEEEKLQKKEARQSSTSSSGVSNYVSSINGKGNPLPANANQFFSSRMGYNFSNVKVHTDKEAADSAKDVNAKAYTVGNHIVFNEGQYNNETDEGKKLMAHELTHIMQQQGRPRMQMKSEEGAETQNENIQDSTIKEEVEATENEEKSMAPVSLPDITTHGKPAMDTVFGKSIRFEGKTEAEFDGGTGQTKKLKATPAKDCDGCSESECMNITGTFEITYNVTTTVTLPDVPEGLTPCQYKLVKAAIDNKIAPHEQEHVSKYNTYNGKATFPINYKGCRDGLVQYLQDINDIDGIQRKAAAKAKSDALDPFFVDVDLDCVEPAPPEK